MLERSTVLFLVGAAVALAAGLLVGVDDNPPGVVLVYAASVSLVLALAHRWRMARKFLILLAVSLGGFVLSAILHNLLYAVAESLPPLKPVAEVFSVAFFLIAVVLCPAGALIGAIGALVRWRNKPESGGLPGHGADVSR